MRQNLTNEAKLNQWPTTIPTRNFKLASSFTTKITLNTWLMVWNNPCPTFQCNPVNNSKTIVFWCLIIFCLDCVTNSRHKLVELLHTLRGLSSYNAGHVFTFTGLVFDHWYSCNAGRIFTYTGRIFEFQHWSSCYIHWVDTLGGFSSFNAGQVFTYTGRVLVF